MTTVVDLVSAPNPQLREQLLPCLPHADILFLNEWEAGQLLGKEAKELTARQAAEMAMAVRKLGVHGVVVLHYPEAVVAASDGGDCLEQKSVDLPPGHIRGTVGAGDALAAGVVLARHHGMEWPEALRLGVCSAAACLRSPTASDGLLPWQDCMAMGIKFGFKKR